MFLPPTNFLNITSTSIVSSWFPLFFLVYHIANLAVPNKSFNKHAFLLIEYLYITPTINILSENTSSKCFNRSVKEFKRSCNRLHFKNKCSKSSCFPQNLYSPPTSGFRGGRHMSVCSYCPVNKPPLQICCSLLYGRLIQGSPPVPHEEIWSQQTWPLWNFNSLERNLMYDF